MDTKVEFPEKKKCSMCDKFSTHGWLHKKDFICESCYRLLSYYELPGEKASEPREYRSASGEIFSKPKEENSNLGEFYSKLKEHESTLSRKSIIPDEEISFSSSSKDFASKHHKTGKKKEYAVIASLILVIVVLVALFSVIVINTKEKAKNIDISTRSTEDTEMVFYNTPTITYENSNTEKQTALYSFFDIGSALIDISKQPQLDAIHLITIPNTLKILKISNSIDSKKDILTSITFDARTEPFELVLENAKLSLINNIFLQSETKLTITANGDNCNICGIGASMSTNHLSCITASDLCININNTEFTISGKAALDSKYISDSAITTNNLVVLGSGTLRLGSNHSEKNGANALVCDESKIKISNTITLLLFNNMEVL